MSMTRVWNVSDDDATSVIPQNLVVLGKVVRPGKSVQVDEARLKLAHKIHKAVLAKLLYIGLTAPGAYVAAKKVHRVKLPRGVSRGHGTVPSAEDVAVATKVVKAVDALTEDTSRVVKAAEVITVEDSAVVEVHEHSKGKGKGRKGHKGK